MIYITYAAPSHAAPYKARRHGSSTVNTKPKISANGTYVLDPEDIEQLNELSLTSVISDVIGSMRQEGSEPEASSDAPMPFEAADTTINELLDLEPSSDDEPFADSGRSAGPETAADAETSGDLLDPALIFTELEPRRR